MFPFHFLLLVIVFLHSCFCDGFSSVLRWRISAPSPYVVVRTRREYKSYLYLRRIFPRHQHTKNDLAKIEATYPLLTLLGTWRSRVGSEQIFLHHSITGPADGTLPIKFPKRILSTQKLNKTETKKEARLICIGKNRYSFVYIQVIFVILAAKILISTNITLKRRNAKRRKSHRSFQT